MRRQNTFLSYLKRTLATAFLSALFLAAALITQPVITSAQTVTPPATTLPTTTQGPTTTTPTTSTTPATDRSCESDAGRLGWIMCAVIESIDAGLRWVDGRIVTLLDIHQSSYDSPRIRSAAAVIRNLAYVILIPIMLVMIISTALGFELVSAYTIKRALPRMVIAVLFMSLAYPICVFLIHLANDVGAGALGLLTSPFGVGDITLNDIFGPSIFQTMLIGPAAVGAIIVAWLFGAPILLFVAIALIVLLLRQMFILALLLVAPLAILAWIFPGNDKLWSGWWSLFSKLLIMYPLIMVLLAIGRIFSFLLIDENAAIQGFQGDLINPLLKLGAYMIPYALIPLTFKFAGGVFATVAGVTNDRTKGLFDRQRQRRAENWAGFKAGSKAPPGLNGNHFAARGMRRVGLGVGAGWKGRGGFGERGSQAIDQATRHASVEQVMKNARWGDINQNDDALLAATYLSGNQARHELARHFRSGIKNDTIEARARRDGISFGAARTSLETEADQRAAGAVAAVQTSIGFGRAQQIAAAQQLVSTGTGYDNLEHMTKTLARAAGGNGSTAAALAGFANAETKKVGRNDMAPGFGTLNTLVRRQAGLERNAQGQVIDAATAVEYAQQTLEASRGSGDGITLLRGKTPALKNFAASLKVELDNAVVMAGNANITIQERNSAIDRMKKALAQIKQLDSDRAYASINNQGVVNDLVSSTVANRQRGMDLLSGEPNAAQHLADLDRLVAARGRIDPNNPNMPQDD